MAWSLLANAANTGTGSVHAITSAIDTTGADLLIAAGVQVGGGVMSDSKSNTWTEIGPSATSAGGQIISLFYVLNPTVGSGHTFDFGGTGAYPTLCVQAWSGSAGGLKDQSNSSASGGLVSSIQPGSITPTQNNELVVTASGWDQAGNTATDPTGYTRTDYIAGVGGVNYADQFEYQIQTTATATNPTWNYSGPNNAAVIIASFKQGTAADSLMAQILL